MTDANQIEYTGLRRESCRLFTCRLVYRKGPALLWMNVILDFMCMVFAELLVTGSKRKIQNENMSFRRKSNQRPLAFQRAGLTTRLSGRLTTCY